MSLTTALFFAASQLFASALGYGGFYVFAGKHKQGFQHNYQVYGLYPTLPNCTTVASFPGYFAMNDVSKDKGVVCQGEGCPQSERDPTRVDRLELNVDFGHYTYYKGRDDNLVDIANIVVGKCQDLRQFMGTDQVDCKFDSKDGPADVRLFPYFWCTTKVWGLSTRAP